VRGARQALSTHGVDALVVAAAVWSAAGIAGEHSYQVEGNPPWWKAAAVAAIVLTLLLRHRLPFAAPAAVWIASPALSFADGRLVTSQAGVFVAGLGAALMLGNLRHDVQARVGLVVVLGGAAVVVNNDPTHQADDLVFTPVLFLLAGLVGYALRQRTEQSEAAEGRAQRIERERESALRLAIAEERARIARELHDVVAHAVSVMVLQVGAVRHGLPAAEEEAAEALGHVERTGRTALAEMRSLLGALGREDASATLRPHPGLADLEPLLAEVRAVGPAATLSVRGEPVPLTPGLDLSAYRIVQEGLTNTLKHAAAQHVDVEVHYRAQDLLLVVRDDGRGVAAGDGQGHGLVGVDERVKVYGGDWSARPCAGGGFELRARLPLSAGLT
jgi:signal transduction histidine kinase